MELDQSLPAITTALWTAISGLGGLGVIIIAAQYGYQWKWSFYLAFILSLPSDAFNGLCDLDETFDDFSEKIDQNVQCIIYNHLTGTLFITLLAEGSDILLYVLH